MFPAATRWFYAASTVVLVAALTFVPSQTSQCWAQGHSVVLEEDPSNPAFPIPNRIYIVGDPGCPVGTPGCFSTRLEDALMHPSDPRVDAFSYGRDFGHFKNTHSYFLFSIECGGGKGAMPKTPLYREPRSECEADIFWVQDRRVLSREPGTHGKASDENNASPVETSYPRNAFFIVEESLDLAGRYGEPGQTSSKQTNIQGYDFWPGPDIEGDIYFSIDRTIVVPIPGGSRTLGPADILLLPGALPAVPESIMIYRPAAELGLDATLDDIDGLAFNLQGESFEGMFVQLFNPTGWFSLTNSSAYLVSPLSGGDIFQFEIDPNTGLLTQELHRTGESMGLFRTIHGDVDSVGHIDPELVQSFSNWTDTVQSTGGSITEEGLLGVSVDEDGNVDFGLAFGPYTGSYAISVDHEPQGAGEGVAGPAQLPSNYFEPGNLVLVELAGQKLVRDLIDQVLVQVPPVGAVPPVTNLTAVADPAVGTIEWSWTNAAAYDDVEVRLDGEPNATSLGAGTTSLLANLSPGEHYLEVRGVLTGDRSPGEFAIANLEPALIQPPNSVSALLLGQGASCPAGAADCRDVELSWNNPVTYDNVVVFLDDTPIGALGNCATQGPCSIVVQNVAAGLHRFTVQGTLAGNQTIESRVRLFVPIGNPVNVTPGHFVFLPAAPLPGPIFPAPSPFVPGQGQTTMIPFPVPIPEPVGDVNVRIALNHPNPEALRVVLINPAGFEVTLVETIGVSGFRIDRMLDGFCDASPDVDDFGTTSPPSEQFDLSIFDGQPAAGNWQVLITNFSPDPGNLEELELHILPQLPDPDFPRGDCNNDTVVNIADPVFVLNVLFGTPGLMPECTDACDANDDGGMDIADAVAILTSLFSMSAPPLPAPGTTCGPDPTPDTLTCFSTACP
ncbi:MAG: proprotein convertase P-domain-containing protein [Planctomycetota bacterium]